MRKRILCLLLALGITIGVSFPAVSEDMDQDAEALPIEEISEEEDETAEEGGDPEGKTAEAGETQTVEIRSLKTGDQGDDVLYLQMRLQSLNYYTGKADGKYGKDTAEAVRQFQEDNAGSGLTANGEADIATQALILTARYRTLRYGSGGEDVKELQSRLAELGYYKGKISGNYLEGSRNGITQFQKDNGLEATGIADARTQEMLFDEDAAGKGDQAAATPEPDISAYYLVDENGSAVPMEGEYIAFTKKLKTGVNGSELVKKLQERMTRLGYYDGPVSGNFANKTKKAVQTIQTQNGMKATGEVDETTWNLIFNNPGLVMPDATPKPTPAPQYAITVDVKNQIVRVYAQDEEGKHTVPVRYMLCSSGKVGTPTPVGDWVLNGRKALWCYFPKWGDYARYWTRINAQVAFHSPIYSDTKLSALKVGSYNMLGNRASHGCVRLSVQDARWVYENVGEGTVVSVREDLPQDQELREALRHDKPATPNGNPPENTPEPEYSKDVKPELKGTLMKGNRSAEVFWVQSRLAELGYYDTKPTGHMLNRTIQAVKDFQKDHGLSQTGNVNQQIIDLMAEAEKVTPQPQATPAP